MHSWFPPHSARSAVENSNPAQASPPIPHAEEAINATEPAAPEQPTDTAAPASRPKVAPKAPKAKGWEIVR